MRSTLFAALCLCAIAAASAFMAPSGFVPALRSGKANCSPRLARSAGPNMMLESVSCPLMRALYVYTSPVRALMRKLRIGTITGAA